MWPLTLKAPKILCNCPRLTLRSRPVDLVRRLAMVSTGIGLNHTGINGKSFTLAQALPMKPDPMIAAFMLVTAVLGIHTYS